MYMYIYVHIHTCIHINDSKKKYIHRKKHAQSNVECTQTDECGVGVLSPFSRCIYSYIYVNIYT